MYEQIELTKIKTRPGRNPMCDWNTMAEELRTASENNCGIIVNLPEGQSLEALRRSVQLIMRQRLNKRVGISIRNHRSINVWVKDDDE